MYSIYFYFLFFAVLRRFSLYRVTKINAKATKTLYDFWASQAKGNDCVKIFCRAWKTGVFTLHSETGSRTAIVTFFQPKAACASASYKTLTVWEIIFDLSQAFHNMTTLYNEYNLPIELQQDTWFLIFYFCEVDWLCGQCSSWASVHWMGHINVRSSLPFTVVQFIQQVFGS